MSEQKTKKEKKISVEEKLAGQLKELDKFTSQERIVQKDISDKDLFKLIQKVNGKFTVSDVFDQKNIIIADVERHSETPLLSMSEVNYRKISFYYDKIKEQGIDINFNLSKKYKLRKDGSFYIKSDDFSLSAFESELNPNLYFNSSYSELHYEERKVIGKLYKSLPYVVKIMDGEYSFHIDTVSSGDWAYKKSFILDNLIEHIKKINDGRDAIIKYNSFIGDVTEVIKKWDK